MLWVKNTAEKHAAHAENEHPTADAPEAVDRDHDPVPGTRLIPVCSLSPVLWRVGMCCPDPKYDVTGDSGTQWRKDGGLIHDLTDRAAATVVYGADGREEGVIFDSSATDAAKSVMTFPVDCYACSEPGETRMMVTDVPHFKEIIVMSFLCDECGFKSVEVKGGGAVPDHGTVHTLCVTPGESHAVDMKRDVIKSDTAMLEIPELELEMSHGSLGGIYTTVRSQTVGAGCVIDVVSLPA